MSNHEHDTSHQRPAKANPRLSFQHSGQERAAIERDASSFDSGSQLHPQQGRTFLEICYSVPHPVLDGRRPFEDRKNSFSCAAGS